MELHDCFATAELVHYDNLMLCEQGGAVDFFESGATWRDGAMPVNVSGGLESKGHPIGATGSMLIGTVLDELERQDKQFGLVTMCAAGGMAPALILERI